MADSKKRLFLRLMAMPLAMLGLSPPAPAKPVSKNMQLMGASYGPSSDQQAANDAVMLWKRRDRAI
ncbi:hypothetical protein SAMN05518800_4756 [Variovorax sp. YR752]|jgi:hypothetical protein|uniref:hypothetical protein n=1 Tax=Variovorax sp. YR752 TaxID=1884383 RepID=UPI000BDCCEE6|nr:hypothetical protein [Variovorax sp. YR752]SOD29162.1 hypothetical protein SAMN05518800_4756 [Variovorax sp. YR752]